MPSSIDSNDVLWENRLHPSSIYERVSTLGYPTCRYDFIIMIFQQKNKEIVVYFWHIVLTTFANPCILVQKNVTYKK